MCKAKMNKSIHVHWIAIYHQGNCVKLLHIDDDQKIEEIVKIVQDLAIQQLMNQKLGVLKKMEKRILKKVVQNQHHIILLFHLCLQHPFLLCLAM
ncbi:hypothetical protein X975_24669, partial [Stegodyphus mimosarum]